MNLACVIFRVCNYISSSALKKPFIVYGGCDIFFLGYIDRPAFYNSGNAICFMLVPFIRCVNA